MWVFFFVLKMYILYSKAFEYGKKLLKYDMYILLLYYINKYIYNEDTFTIHNGMPFNEYR